MNEPKQLPLVSCCMCTYGRWQMVQRAIACFLEQRYPNKELVIFNTAPASLRLAESLAGSGTVRLVNCSTYSKTGEPYTSIGQIREDALTQCRGVIYNCYDDDDLYLPWHVSQGVERLLACGKWAWKPKRSFYSADAAHTFELAENAMEASIFVLMDALRAHGFRHETGSEHLGWLSTAEKARMIESDPDGVPAYAFCWGEPLAQHKQSGDITNPNNFENHKRASTDFGDGKPLTGDYDVQQFYDRLIEQFPKLLPYFKPEYRV